MRNPFRSFSGSSDVIRIAVMLHIHCPFWLRQIEHPLFKRGMYIFHETVRFSCNPFEAIFATTICNCCCQDSPGNIHRALCGS